MPRVRKTDRPIPKNLNKTGLVSLADRTAAERSEIARKGAIASNKAQKDKRTMKEIARALLAEQAKPELIEALGLSEGASNATAILASMLKEAAENGSVKAAEYVRDTSGQAPTKEVSLKADVMTDADRALVDKVSKRIKETAGKATE